MGLGLNVGVISFGQIIRDKIDKDPNFAREYGKSVGKGKLLDDTVAIELFKEAYDELCINGKPDIVIIDGFCRSTRQIAWASQHGFLKASDVVIMLTARLQTCLDRFLHRKQQDQGRIDAEVATFHARFHLHEHTVPDLRAMLRDTGPTVIDIDADRDIAEHVHPVVTSALLPTVFKVMRSKSKEPLTVT